MMILKLSVKSLIFAGITLLPLIISQPATWMLPAGSAQSTDIQSKDDQAYELFQQGIDHFQNDRPQDALTSWENALKIYRAIGNRQGEGDCLNSIGEVFRHWDNHPVAIDYYQQALSIAREIDNKVGEANALTNLGAAYSELRQYPEAIDFLQQQLDITQAIDYDLAQAIALENLGDIYFELEQFEKSIGTYKQQLAIAQKIADRNEESQAVSNLGSVYRKLHQYENAIAAYERQIEITQEIGDLEEEANALGGLGLAYLGQGRYRRALSLLEDQVETARNINNRTIEGWALGNLIIAYRNLDRYQDAINAAEQRLEIATELEDKSGIETALGNLGNIYDELGQYQKAINYFEQALAVAQENNNPRNIGRALGNLGLVHTRLDNYPEAIKFYEDQLKVTRNIDDRIGEGRALSNLGILHLGRGDLQLASTLFEEGLVIFQEVGHRGDEGTALSNLGIIQRRLGDTEKALKFYEQHLLITRSNGNRSEEARVLDHIAAIFHADQPKLATVFYKQSVNIRKNIGHDIKDSLLKQSYVERVSANTYRLLADVLLSLGRMSETHQVLELLKFQELNEYIENNQELSTLPDVALLPEERKAFEAYTFLLVVKQELEGCEATNCEILSFFQKELVSAQYAFQVAVTELENHDSNSPDEAIERSTTFFTEHVQAVVSAQSGTIAIYPLVLEEHLWLLWATSSGFGSHKVSGVGQADLAQTITSFRNSLESRYSDLETLQADAQQLYDWLIAPIKANVDDHEIRHLVLALDRNTRYIPIAALYDGQQYLIEKYDISTILSASLTNTEDRVPIGTDDVAILAAGVSRKFENFPVLPNVRIELDTIVREQNNTNDQVGIYVGQQLLDPDFTAQNLRNSLSSDVRFLHIATHGEFVPGDRYASYLLLGNGEKLPIPEITNLGDALANVHLTVLSACQTGLGGTDEEGLEIAGLGYYFFQNQVDAVMASLWNVNDASTSRLMQAFYQTLYESTEANPITKAEALRTAQLSLLQSNEPGNPDADRFRRIPKNPDDQPRPDSGLAHPYYWAPFILIGNGL